MLSNKKMWFAIIAVILVLGAGGYYYYTSTATAAAEEAAADDEVQTAPVRRGDIMISAVGAGTIVPSTEIALAFDGNGRLQTLPVAIGDEVQMGDLLAELDSNDAQQAVANAELQLAQVAMQVDGSGTSAGTSYGAISTEQAQINLEQAETKLYDLQNWVADEDDIAKAEASLAAAEASYNAALGQESANYSSVTLKSISLEQAQRDLADAQGNYTVAFDTGRDWELDVPRTAAALENERAAAERNLQKAEDNLAIAQTNYGAAVSSSNSSSSTNAESSILNAQQALELALSGPTDDEILAAETAVRQTELALQQAELNQEANQINYQQSALNLEAAQRALAGTSLTAPIDGTIMSISATVGEQVSGVLMNIADLDQPMLEVYMDEADIDKIGVDFEVDVIFDAMPDDTYKGHVVQVDPQLSVISGVTAVRAIIALDDFAKPQNLPVGLNATVDIIGGQAENALLVPVEALRELSPGQFAVFVMNENGEPEMVFVEVGLMDYTYAEILSGLEQGDVVTTGIIETN